MVVGKFFIILSFILIFSCSLNDERKILIGDLKSFSSFSEINEKYTVVESKITNLNGHEIKFVQISDDFFNDFPVVSKLIFFEDKLVSIYMYPDSFLNYIDKYFPELLNVKSGENIEQNGVLIWKHKDESINQMYVAISDKKLLKQYLDALSK